MSLTLPEFASLRDEVAATAVPAGVQKVFERDDHAVVLQLRGSGETSYLLIDTTPGATRFHLAEQKPTQPPTPGAFTMLLRKHLIGTGLVAVEQVAGDRILRLRFERSGEGSRTRELVAELTGRHGNLFLLNDGGILGALTSTDGERDLRPGEQWEAPPPPPVDLAQEDRFSELEIGARSVAVADHFERLLRDRHERELKTRLRAGLKREAKRLRRLRKNVEEDLTRAEEAQGYRKYGELLQSAYGQDVPRGTEFVEVPDYYADGTPKISVPLDPTKSLQQNIERYFHEYRRLNGAIDTIESRLLETMEKLEEVEAAREQLDSILGCELDDFADDVETRGLLRERQKQRRRRDDGRSELPYRMFRTKKGTAILVGRNAKKNDELTTRHARGRDVWLHARDWPGSHVVLRMERNGEPDGEDLLDAAVLAAHFCRGQGDSLIDVTHTRAKHVRKPKGAAAGLVTVAGGSTLAVSPDAGRLERLFASEERG